MKQILRAVGVACAASLVGALTSGSASAVTTCAAIDTTGYSDGLCNARQADPSPPPYVLITEPAAESGVEASISTRDSAPGALFFGNVVNSYFTPPSSNSFRIGIYDPLSEGGGLSDILVITNTTDPAVHTASLTSGNVSGSEFLVTLTETGLWQDLGLLMVNALCASQSCDATKLANAHTDLDGWIYFFSDIDRSSEVPLPAALPLFATGLSALGLLGWRRKRKNAATLAA